MRYRKVLRLKGIPSAYGDPRSTLTASLRGGRSIRQGGIEVR